MLNAIYCHGAYISHSIQLSLYKDYAQVFIGSKFIKVSLTDGLRTRLGKHWACSAMTSGKLVHSYVTNLFANNRRKLSNAI